MAIKGIAFHWEDPWKDIYSGLDSMASAWVSLGRAFDLRLMAIECRWPFPSGSGVTSVRSVVEALQVIEFSGHTVSLADTKGGQEDHRIETDWIVFGPASGWRGAFPDIKRWVYRYTPQGGFHAIHVAHIAAHIACSGGE